jgi:hypothetical protein
LITQIDSAFVVMASHNGDVNELYVVSMCVPGGIQLDELESGSEEEGEDQKPDVKTTFAHFGLAYYQASVLEHEIVNILAASRLVAARRDAEQLLSDPWDDKFKNTMGALVKQLGAHAQVDPELAADLVEALQRRNNLAHAFWREWANDFCSDDGRARMIAYLIETRKHFQAVDQRLTETVGTAVLQESGVTPEIVDAWYSDMLGRVERGELNVPLSMIESARQSVARRLTCSISSIPDPPAH